MTTSAQVIPEHLWVKGPIHVEPGKDIALSVDATRAFGPGGTLEVHGAAEAAVVDADTSRRFGRTNSLAVADAHVPGSAHAHGAYTQEAGIVPNQTLLSEEQIAAWIQMGEERILQPHAQFSLSQLRTDARLTQMFTGRPQIVWAQHACIGSEETLFIPPVVPEDFCNIFYKGTHPTRDSHSGIWDAVGNPVGVMAAIAARRERVRRIFVKGNALEVCIYLTLMNLARFGIEVFIVMDGVGYLSFIDDSTRAALVENLQRAGVRFVHSDELTYN